MTTKTVHKSNFTNNFPNILSFSPKSWGSSLVQTHTRALTCVLRVHYAFEAGCSGSSFFLFAKWGVAAIGLCTWRRRDVTLFLSGPCSFPHFLLLYFRRWFTPSKHRSLHKIEDQLQIFCYIFVGWVKCNLFIFFSVQVCILWFTNHLFVKVHQN